MRYGVFMCGLFYLVLFTHTLEAALLPDDISSQSLSSSTQPLPQWQANPSLPTAEHTTSPNSTTPLESNALESNTIAPISPESYTQQTTQHSTTPQANPQTPQQEITPNLAQTQALTNSRPMSFQEAYVALLESSETIKAQHFNVARSKKLALGAKLSFLPEVNASVFYTHLDRSIQERLPLQSHTLPPQLAQQFAPLLTQLSQPIILLDQNIIIGALSAIYPIYTGGARIQQIKLATIAHKDAKEALRLKKLGVFEDLATLYYGAVLAHNITQVLESSRQGALLHYENAKSLEKSGQIAHLEVLAAQVAYDTANNALQQAQNTATIASLTLDSALQAGELKTDSPHITPLSTLKLAQKQLPTEAYFVQKTLDSYPALASLDLKIASAKSAKNLAIAPFLPQIVAFGAAYANNANHAVIMRAIPTWHIGLSANISLITPRARIQSYQAAKLTQLEAQSLAEQARKDITLLVRKTYKQAIYAQEEYASKEHSIALAKEQLKLQQNAFKQGLATSAQVADAQTALQNAYIQQQTSAYNAFIAIARLYALCDMTDEFYAYDGTNYQASHNANTP